MHTLLLSCTQFFPGDERMVLKPNPSFMPEVVGSHSPNDLATQCLAHWATEAFTLAHSNQGLQPPAGLRAHSTWSLATLWAFFRDVDLGEICATARWASPLTCVRVQHRQFFCSDLVRFTPAGWWVPDQLSSTAGAIISHCETSSDVLWKTAWGFSHNPGSLITMRYERESKKAQSSNGLTVC